MQQDAKGLAEAIKDGRVAIEIQGREYVFRLPDLEDFVVVNEQYPTIPNVEEVEEKGGDAAVVEEIFKSPAALKDYLGRVNRMLELCSLRPKIVQEFDADAPMNGTVPVRSIPHNSRIAAHMWLCSLSSARAESEVSVRPFSDARLPSSSTASGSDTDVSPAKSSEAPSSPEGNG